MNLTRQEVTTFLRQPVNLGCYATTTSAGSILEYYWTKDNQTVTQSPNVQAFDGVLVVTPEKDSDFGTYECNVTNGMSSGLCRISLVQVTSTPGKHREYLEFCIKTKGPGVIGRKKLKKRELFWATAYSLCEGSNRD